jgi:hypothetical protein
MENEFFTLLTVAGAEDLVSAQTLDVRVPLTHVAVGDGLGYPVTPGEEMTALKNEVYRVPVASISVDEDNPDCLVVSAIIPPDAGGWTIREIGLFGGLNREAPLDTPSNPGNRLLAIGNFPETYKPLPGDGAAKDMEVRMIVHVGNADVVILGIDATIVIATKRDLAQAIIAHKDEQHPHDDRYVRLTHLTDIDPHTQYYNDSRLSLRTATETRTGIIELATQEEVLAGTDTTRAITPAGLSARTATEARTGIVEFATPAEVLAGTDTTRAITPAGLSARTATETRTGIAELATVAEAKAGADTTRAVTPAGLKAAIAAAIAELLSSGGVGVPVGTLIHFWGLYPPPGFFWCNGATFSATTYPELYQLLGSSILPDLRGCVLRGYDPNGFRDPDGAGRAIGSIQSDAGRNVTGAFSTEALFSGATGTATIEGAFYMRDYNVGNQKHIASPIGGGNQTAGFDAARVWGAQHTASEFRMVNANVMICIRAAK